MEYCEFCDLDNDEHFNAITTSGKILWGWVGEFSLILFTEVKDGGVCDDYVTVPISFCPFCGRCLG